MSGIDEGKLISYDKLLAFNASLVRGGLDVDHTILMSGIDLSPFAAPEPGLFTHCAFPLPVTVLVHIHMLRAQTGFIP